MDGWIQQHVNHYSIQICYLCGLLFGYSKETYEFDITSLGLDPDFSKEFGKFVQTAYAIVQEKMAHDPPMKDLNRLSFFDHYLNRKIHTQMQLEFTLLLDKLDNVVTALRKCVDVDVEEFSKFIERGEMYCGDKRVSRTDLDRMKKMKFSVHKSATTKSRMVWTRDIISSWRSSVIRAETEIWVHRPTQALRPQQAISLEKVPEYRVLVLSGEWKNRIVNVHPYMLRPLKRTCTYSENFKIRVQISKMF